MNYKLIVMMIIFLVCGIRVSAQQSVVTEYKKSYWIDFGPGWSSRDKAFTASLNVELEKRYLISLSYENAYYPTGLEELASAFSFGLLPVAYKPGFDTQSISLKIGKVLKGNLGLVAFSAGISSVKATEYSRTTSLGSSSAVGVSVTMKLMPAIKFIGVAFTPFLTINGIQNHGGLTINLALGQIKYIDN